MNNLPTVVAGLGRCGSSMMVQILHQGGLSLTGDADLPFMEDSRATELPDNNEWLKEIDARHVVKILGPDMYPPPHWFKCKAIWMRRNIDEQAKSYIKYNLQRDGMTPGLNAPEVKKNIRRRTKASLDVLDRITDGNYLVVNFEDVVKDPLIVADKINEYLGTELNTEGMAEAVVKRDPKCLKDIPELKFVYNYKIPRALKDL